MMMVCPKCGFSQPADRFCAQCGVDVSHFQAKPKPWIIRLIQDPNTHLFLVGCLVVVILGYIFYTQRGLLGKEMGTLLNDIPLLSRDAGDKTTSSTVSAKPAAPAAAQPAAPAEKVETAADSAGLLPEAKKETAASADVPAPTKEVEASFWEVSHTAISSLVGTADKADNGEGKVFIWTDSTKVLPAIEANGNELEYEGNRKAPAGQALVIADGSEGAPLQFTAQIVVTKSPGQNADDTAKVTLNWRMAMAEAGKVETASMSATATIPPNGVAMIIIDLEDKAVSAEALQYAGGPMSILASNRFKTGATDWVMLLRANPNK